jgi:peptide deformylase
MAVREVLLLGNPKLYEVCEEIAPDELPQLQPVVADLHDTLMQFREEYGAGRAIAAPQIGCMKRLVYMCIDEPVVLINPVIDRKSEKKIDVWDDCMSFPDLLVKVKRHYSCRITYQDMNWQAQVMELEGDLSELLQHECDHLDGILATMRAIDRYSFAYRGQRPTGLAAASTSPPTSTRMG